MGRILIIDDDVQVCETIESLIARAGHDSVSAYNLKDGIAKVHESDFDLVFLDISLPDGNGLDYLQQVKDSHGEPEVIILTGKGDADGAELAIQGGAWDFLVKPSSVKQISLTMSRALDFHTEKQSTAHCVALNLDNIVGKSSEIKSCYDLIAHASGSDANVLVNGETGTGKELFAHTIHKNSKRADKNFVVVDCASLTETLVESTLFGHKRGAFTGAQSDRKGLIPLADKGTLFLDEIGEMPLAVQKSFLRVLQERTYRPVGENKEFKSDFRLIGATNRDLEAMAAKGDFRQDLLYRLQTIHIYLPPLRDREGDIRELTTFHLSRLSSQYGVPPKVANSDFYDVLNNYDWPGNVRQLFNIVEQAFVASGTGNTIYAMHLSDALRIKMAKSNLKKSNDLAADMLNKSVAAESEEEAPQPQSAFSATVANLLSDDLPPLKLFKGMAEKRYLEELLVRYHGDIATILKISGLSRSHFYALLKKHGIND
ncbi:sigma-54-dependent transcriptional regulator [Maridesulfovibrio hydrothermalis]|uniref:Putative two component, sigma54 specific, transcriptional regulator, Fis family n=1 Tax=Maridesulfovibrio hydrothermalis AM13 = DSM 14728 TaxID=1121451 RepID=L0RDU4_9BACT|nr:sigma-54 dependent transcriptional regulator [Maridesulfovibrio hydrothermalis]CCO24938.1 putative two component, sigma54 specific, transcriptional regulator, Fis family [Maridesulfovibrio hydrothermalis AM13 = DSM 14728]